VIAPDDQVQRYRIVARGESPVLLGGVADGLQIESGRGWTSVVASVRDESELWGLLGRFQDLAMHLASINELGAAAMRSLPETADRRVGDGGGPAGGWRQWLAGAAASDPDVLTHATGPEAGTIDLSGLDIRTHALVRLAALVAAGESRDPIRSACETALDRGVTGAEITGMLVALLPALGADRIAAAAHTVLSCF
jgi:alkylhydroperoxidase/carboxymuconolactone decarboxylase family protein YurZ